MQIQEQLGLRTIGQNVQQLEQLRNNGKSTEPFIINGCTISFSSANKVANDPMTTIKEILLSAYRTKQIKG